MDGGWGRGGQKIALRIVFIGLVISFGGGGGEGRRMEIYYYHRCRD